VLLLCVIDRLLLAIGSEATEYFHTINDSSWVLKKIDGMKQVLHKEEESLNGKVIHFRK
jgi:hypothetical protein